MGTPSWWHELCFTGPSPEDPAYDWLIELATDGLGFEFQGGHSTADANEDPTAVAWDKANQRVQELEAALEEAQEQRQNAQSRTNDLRREIFNLRNHVARLRDQQPERVELEARIDHLESACARIKHNGLKAEQRAAELEAAATQFALDALAQAVPEDANRIMAESSYGRLKELLASKGEQA